MADKPVTREEKYLAYLTGDYTGEIPKPITRKEKYLYELCLKGIGGEISPEEIKNAVNEYLEKNPVNPGATTEQAQQIEQNKTDIASLKTETGSLKEDKVDKPSITDDGKIPRAKSGGVEWVEVGQPTDEQTSNAVTSWLNEHPEVTTTVQDGSVTEQKIFSSFLPYIKKDYITPQMFGAKGDGATDDTKAIQEAIVFCENNKRLLYIPSGVYMVSDTLTISKSIAILGSSVHKDVLSSYDKYMGISVLKFIAKSDKTFIVASEKAYDVSINSLVFFSYII